MIKGTTMKFAYFFIVLSLTSQAEDLQITSIHELLKTHPEIEYIKCHDAQPFAYEPFPISAFPELQPHKGLFAETFIAKIPHGRVCSYRGFIKVDNAIISEFIPPYGSSTHQKLSLKRYSFTNSKNIKGRVVVITMLWDSYYGHWLWNILGRLALVEEQGIEYDWVYVAYDKPYMKETLALWGIDPAKIITPFGRTGYIEADELIVPSHIGDRAPLPHEYVMKWIPFEQLNQKWNLSKDLYLWGNSISQKYDKLPKDIAIQNYFLRWTTLCGSYFCPWGVSYIRNKFLPHLQKKSFHFSKKIFISRHDSNRRIMINENEIWALFEPLGFKKYTLSKLSFLEQMALFNGAEIIVAAHGTALINSLFAKPGTTIIEIFQNRSDCCFYYLSQLLQLHHYCIKTTDFCDIDGDKHSYVDPDIIQNFIGEHKALFNKEEDK